VIVDLQIYNLFWSDRDRFKRIFMRF